MMCERFAFKATHYVCKHNHGTHIEHFKLRKLTTFIGVLLPNTQKYLGSKNLSVKIKLQHIFCD